MTTREIADAAGVSVDTVGRKIKELFPTITEKRKKTILNQSQAIEVMKSLRKINFVELNAVALPQNAVDNRIDKLESMMEKLISLVTIVVSQKQELKQIEAPQIATRDELRRIVNKAAHDSGDYAGTWNRLYSEIYYRLHINAKERAQNNGTQAIDILEAEGFIPEAVAIAREIFQ